MTCEPNQEQAARVELEVNGKEVELNSFVQNFISETVIGMVKSLRSVGEIDTVSLKVSRKAK